MYSTKTLLKDMHSAAGLCNCICLAAGAFNLLLRRRVCWPRILWVVYSVVVSFMEAFHHTSAAASKLFHILIRYESFWVLNYWSRDKSSPSGPIKCPLPCPQPSRIKCFLGVISRATK